MTKRSIFAKIFLITFALFSSLVILPDGIEDLSAGPGLAFMLEQVFQDFQLLGIHGNSLPS